MGLVCKKRIQKLESAISQDEYKIEQQMDRIREYVNTHSTEDILKTLPCELSVASDAAAELRKLKLRLRLLKIFCGDQEMPAP